MADDYAKRMAPLLSELVFTEMEDGDYVVECKDTERFFKINGAAFFVLSSIQRGKGEADIIAEYNSQHEARISLENLEFLFQRLTAIGLGGTSSGTKSARRKKSPIYFRIRILSEVLINKLSRSLGFLFKSKLFLLLFPCSVVFVISFFIIQWRAHGNATSSSAITKILYFFLLLFFQLFHEIGHASAGISYGVKTKEIGFGFFYGVIPVFYSDLTRIWTLPAQKRIMVNLGGIYLDFLTSTLSIFLWFLFKWDFFLMYPFVIVGTTLRNLNIFLRYDGYWALSDLMKSDGLQAEANEAVLKLIRERKLIQPDKRSRSIFMIIYGLLSYSYMVIFIFILLIGYYKPILSFPLLFRPLIHGDLSGFITMIEGKTLTAIVVPLLFYVIVIVKMYRYASQWVSKLR